MIKLSKKTISIMKKKETKKILSNNIKHDFELIEKYEAGIILKGTEVKSCINKHIIMDKAHIKINDNEILINELYISQYRHGNINNHIPNRIRKLLMHKAEIIKLKEKMKKENNLSIIPIKIYIIKNGKIKIELAIGKKKNIIDNREKMKKEESTIQARKYKKI